jgi:hypothetical protein
MAKEKSEKEKSFLLALLLFIGAGLLLLLALDSESPRRGIGSDSRTKTPEFEKNVNKHLMLTNDKLTMAQQKMALENARVNEFGQTKPQQAYSNSDSGLDLSVDRRAYEIANELGRGEKKRDHQQPMTPDEMIQRDLFEAQQNQEYSQAYREEYARQFVENARRGGYKVILSEDLTRVISVQPIRRPSESMDLFQSNGEALQ